MPRTRCRNPCCAPGLRAWKGLDGFDARSSLRTWLYRIAPNVCLETLGATERQRLRPLELSEHALERAKGGEPAAV
ncbi:MAG: polymerase sigma-70 factor [Gemmatimonadetes bacterium]|jgi:RNA polymerase sigma-70 factor (ECF subfamily)|nr:polymerase sigma-70 factor [Gemmatimonadota bacterium]